jgi:hypothetical protein
MEGRHDKSGCPTGSASTWESIPGLLKRFTDTGFGRNGTQNYQCTADFENFGDYFLFFQKSLGPLKISLEMTHKVICLQKRTISRIFKISGT